MRRTSHLALDRRRTSVVSVAVSIALAVVLVPGPGDRAGAAVPNDLVFPQDPEVTTFSNSWGVPRSGGRRHRGTDLLAPKLSPVFAVADGVVSRLDWSRLGGFGLWIDHGEFVSVYLHLNNDTPGTDDGKSHPAWTYAPGIAEGVRVSAGQFVAFVGDSGNAERTTPHTHFELHVGNGKVNPYPHLAAAWARATGNGAAAFADGEPLDEQPIPTSIGMFAD